MPFLQLVQDGATELALVAAIGLVVGSVINRCVVRLSLEQSPFWPLRRYCDRCRQPLPLRFSVPLVGGLLCFYRCRRCRARLPLRGPVIELLTAILLCFLYTHHVLWRGYYSIPDIGPMVGMDAPKLHALFVYHGILYCLLIATTFIDLDYMIVPDSVTLPGIVAGLVLGAVWYIELHPVSIWMPLPNLENFFGAEAWSGLWSRWLPGESLPAGLDAVRSTIDSYWRNDGAFVRWLGFLTGLTGAVVGAGVTWAIRAILSCAFGKEAMGFGDVILMAMIGAFLGWQAAIMVLIVFAPVSGIVVGFLGWIVTRRAEFAFVPHLSIGAIALTFAWRPVWRNAYFSVFDLVYAEAGYAAAGVGVMLVVLVIVALGVQWTKGMFQRAFLR